MVNLGWVFGAAAVRGSRRFTSARVSVALAAIMAMALAACSGSSGSDDSETGQVLNIGIVSPPQSLDPAQDAGVWQFARSLMYEGLVSEQPDGTFAPALATEWGYVGEGYTEFEVVLREGVKFSDGVDLDAAAVKTWVEYVRDLGKSVFIGDMGQLAEVEVVDDLTVRFHFDEPNIAMPYKLGQHDSGWGTLASPEAVAQPESLSAGTYGAGPYVLDQEESVSGQTYVLVPNQHYYDQDAIRWSKVVLRVIPQASSMLQAVSSGQVDVAFGDASTRDEASELVGVDVKCAWGQTAGVILQNRVEGPLSDVRVRQALNYAIDREAITESIIGGVSVPSSTILSSDAVTDEAQNYYDYDPARAQELLDEAGYGDGFTIRLAMPSYVRLGVPMGQAMASYWQEIGVRTDIMPYADPAAGVAIFLGKEFDASYLITSPGPFQFSYWSAMRPGGGARNAFDAQDPGLDELWEQATQSEDPQPVLQEMNLRATEQAYFVPVMFAEQCYYVREEKVTGVVVPDARASVPWATEWSPAKD